MNNRLIAEFFDDLSSDWDEHMEDADATISAIIDTIEPLEGKDILDVGAGTGVLVPFFLERKVSSIMEADMSHGMLEENRRKWGKDERISYIEGDAAEAEFGRKFDSIIIYNAFPHFSDREKLLANLADHLRKGGHLVIAHSRSGKAISQHHGNISTELYSILPEPEELARLLSDRFDDLKFQDEPYFYVSGTLR